MTSFVLSERMSPAPPAPAGDGVGGCTAADRNLFRRSLPHSQVGGAFLGSQELKYATTVAESTTHTDGLCVRNACNRPLRRMRLARNASDAQNAGRSWGELNLCGCGREAREIPHVEARHSLAETAVAQSTAGKNVYDRSVRGPVAGRRAAVFRSKFSSRSAARCGRLRGLRKLPGRPDCSVVVLCLEARQAFSTNGGRLYTTLTARRPRVKHLRLLIR